MSGVNKVILVGRLGSDVELKTLSGDKKVAQMSIATSETWTKDDKKQERTEWHRVVVWSKLAELCGKYLSKGKQVYIEGKLQTRSWEDQQGQKKYTTEVVANHVQFLSGTGKQSDSNPGTENHAPDGNPPNFDSADEIPF